MVRPDLRNHKIRKISLQIRDVGLVEFEAPCSVDKDGVKYFHEKDIDVVCDAFDKAIKNMD